MNLRTYALGVLLDFLKQVRFDITLRDGASAFRIDQGIVSNVVVGIQRSAADPSLGVRVLPMKDYPSVVPNGPPLPSGVGALYNDRFNVIFIADEDASYHGDLESYIRSRVVHESVHAGFDIWRYAIPVATEEVAAHLVQTLYLRAKGFSIGDLPQGTKITPVLEACGRLLDAKSLTPAGTCSADFSAAELADLRQMIVRLQGMQTPGGTRSADRIGVASFDFGGRTRALEFRQCR